MNLDQYRAMKAEESKPKEEQSNAQTNENTVIPAEQAPQTPEPTSPASTNEDAETNPQTGDSTRTETVEIDGQEVSLDELKGGYLRQSDYTRKTQELARIKKELEKAEEVYNALHKDPETAQEISERLGVAYVSPEQAKIQEMQVAYQELVLERDIEKLQAKFGDFDVNEVLQLAFDKRIDDLEDAYHLAVSKKEAQPKTDQTLDIDAIKEQIRQELKRELQSSVDTSSIITTGGSGAPITDDTPQLTAQELRVAQAMKMSPVEYAKHKTRK